MIQRVLFCILISIVSIQIKAQVAGIIDVGQLKQQIDGFGASTAWHGAITDVEADAAFGNDTESQMGLSILRVCISPNSGSWAAEKSNAQKAKARGAMVLATPWSPPATMKTNNNTIGGELLATSYAAYADHLKSFCTYNGNVDVVSLQNEPNITVSYESCTWSAAQLLIFCRANAPAIGKPVMAPETYNFNFSYSDPILNDPTASANVQYIGGHLYGTSTRNYPLATTKGKKLWMTEHYYNPDSMGTCMLMAKDMLDCLYGNMNAYIWWYLRTPGCNLINTNGTLKLKGYTMGQFSKFIRPGYYRVNATYQPNPSIYMVAFKGPDQDIVVVVNMNRTVKTQVFNFLNENIVNATKFVTSATKRITYDGTITASNNSFSDNLDARSVTTYMIQRAPTLLQNADCVRLSLIQHPDGRFIELSNLEQVKSWTIFNMQGRKIRTMKQPKVSTIDVSALPIGAYMLQVNQNGTLRSMKFVKI